jgi:hypothetical protein
MLSTFGILFLVSAVYVFFWTLRKGNFRRYPWEQFVFLGIAVSLGARAVVERPSLLNGALLFIEIVALTGSLLYFGMGARFRRSRVSVLVGERLPNFILPDSTGKSFHSESLEGETAALYLFYRGDW